MLRRSWIRWFATVACGSTPNPDSFKFVSGNDDFLPSDMTCVIPYKTLANIHPLSEVLFDQYENEIRSVFLAQKYITITKWSDVDWSFALERSLQQCIQEYLMENEPISPTDAELTLRDDDLAVKPGDSEVVECVKELLKSEIRPMIQRDGGDVRFVAFDETTGVVKLALLGACQTCPSSQNTLKFGIERLLKHFLPEIKEIVEVKEEQTIDLARQRARKASRHPDDERKDELIQEDERVSATNAVKARADAERVESFRRESSKRRRNGVLMSEDELMEPEA